MRIPLPDWVKEPLRGSRLHRMWQSWEDRRMPLPIRMNRAYDRDTVRVMERVLRRDSSGIDVGAHDGDILQHLVSLAPDGQHHAIEALPHMAERLRTRFPQVHVHSVAVSDHEGEATFQFVENAPSYSGLRRRIYDRPDPVIRDLPVRVTTIDACVPPDQRIAFLKLDIEGGEFHALKGAERTLRSWRPVIVFEAAHGSSGQYGVSADDLFSLLNTHGYNVTLMQWWLQRTTRVFTRERFRQNWQDGRDFYFLAAPGATSL